MDLSWQKRKAAPIGLQKQKLGYHLHEQIGRDSSAEREQAEADVFGPPRTDSDEEELSSPPRNPPLKLASQPPAKRRRLNTRSSQQIHQTSPSHGKKEPDLADIPRTVFTTSRSTSDHHSSANENRVPSSTSQSQTVVKDDCDDEFPGYKASQSKKGKTYGRTVNFHKAAPVEPEKEQARTKSEKNKSMIKRQPDGFRVVDTDAFEALGMGLIHDRLGHMLILTSSISRKGACTGRFQTTSWSISQPKVREGE